MRLFREGMIGVRGVVGEITHGSGFHPDDRDGSERAVERVHAAEGGALRTGEGGGGVGH